MLAKLIALSAMALFLIACGGGGSDPTPPTPTTTPTLALIPTSTLAATDVPEPPMETPIVTESVPTGFVDIAACLEESLGSEVARALLSGEKQESPEEEAILNDCLLITASGVSADDLTPAVAACLEDRLGTGVVDVVGSGARQLTPEEETVFLDCIVTSAVETDSLAEATSFEGCLEQRLGPDLALVVASGSVPLNDDETEALNACLMVSALSETAQTPEQLLVACLAEQLDPEYAPVVAAQAVPLTEAEEVILQGCLLTTTLEASTESGSEGLSTRVIACLELELGEEIAAVVASGAVPLSSAEEEIRGECILSSSLDASSEAASQTVLACLEKELGADLASVVASGAIPLSEDEERIMGDCVLEQALGSSP